MTTQRRKTTAQFARYLMVGVLTNATGFALYLLFTSQGLAPLLTISLLYPTASIAAFLGNRSFTFSYGGRMGKSAIRYIGAQFSGYLLNGGLLWLFAGQPGVGHQYVQALATIIVGLWLFMLMRVFVFRQP